MMKLFEKIYKFRFKLWFN